MDPRTMAKSGTPAKQNKPTVKVELKRVSRASDEVHVIVSQAKLWNTPTKTIGKV